jgi:hypothetical protein
VPSINPRNEAQFDTNIRKDCRKMLRLLDIVSSLGRLPSKPAAAVMTAVTATTF